jgi:hypothetical protein
MTFQRTAGVISRRRREARATAISALAGRFLEPGTPGRCPDCGGPWSYSGNARLGEMVNATCLYCHHFGPLWDEEQRILHHLGIDS